LVWSGKRPIDFAKASNQCVPESSEEQKEEIQVSQVQLESASQHGVVLAVLAHLENGGNSEATAYFSGNVDFNDHGIGWNVRTQGD
jgi:hypothetical protein